MQVNLHAPTSGRATMNKSLLGTLGIPDSNRLFGDETFKVNLHAPTSGRATMNKSLLGALGIPELMPPIRQRDF